MAHRRGGAALQMLDAADVGADDHLRLQRRQAGELAIAQLVRKLRLQQAVGARRAATEVAVAGREADIEAQHGQVRFNPAAQLLTMLQRARRMKGQARLLRLAQLASETWRQIG